MTNPDTPGYGNPSDGYPSGLDHPQARNGSTRNAIAPWALGVAIIALLICWVPVFNWLLAAIGVILGIVGIIKAKGVTGSKNGKGLSIAAIIISVVAIILSVVLAWALVQFIGTENIESITECNSIEDTTERERCIEERAEQIRQDKIDSANTEN
ncbi:MULTISPECIES: hypothetical protein [unclassified Corynebacterium]|uniref:hypothetical protein n=1 Tax=unclassified Corynebacterium TaxID=2624378 RepID=UPI0035258B99